MSDHPPESASAFLNYNVRWMSRTFNSRSRTETLLGPQLTAGNISSHDYDAAIKFLPSYQRYYSLIFSSIALSAVYVFRKPSWSQKRLLGVGVASSFGSLALGNAYTLKSHFDFVRSLDNPAGFSRALQQIQKEIGLPPAVGPVITRKVEVEEGLHGNNDTFQVFVNAAPEPMQEQPASHMQSQAPQAQHQGDEPLSRWDQIRTINAPSSSSSSWDAIRQKHEKARVPTATQNNALPEQSADRNDQAAEQARFDALLEKERNLGST